VDELLRTFWGQLALFCTTWAAASGMIWKLFELVEKTASPAARKETAIWLGNVDATAPIRFVARSFNHAFDAVFGERHFSVRCFAVSSAASTAVVLLVMAFAVLLQRSRGDFVVFSPGSPIALVSIALSNWIPDYLSLLKSRKILSWMAVSRWPWFWLLIVVDILLSAVIGVVSMIVLGFPALSMLAGDSGREIWHNVTVVLPIVPAAVLDGWSGVVELLDEITPMLLFDSNDGLGLGEGFVAVFFYGTFMTSTWVLLYGISTGLVRLAAALRRGMGLARWFLDIENQPFQSIGVMLIILVTVASIPLAVLGLV
jgi:hypothetical protein